MGRTGSLVTHLNAYEVWSPDSIIEDQYELMINPDLTFDELMEVIKDNTTTSYFELQPVSTMYGAFSLAFRCLPDTLLEGLSLNPSLPEGVVEQALYPDAGKRYSKEVLMNLLDHPTVLPESLLEYALDKEWEVRQLVAGHVRTPAEWIEVLLDDANVKVVKTAMFNPVLPLEKAIQRLLDKWVYFSDGDKNLVKARALAEFERMGVLDDWKDVPWSWQVKFFGGNPPPSF